MRCCLLPHSRSAQIQPHALKLSLSFASYSFPSHALRGAAAVPRPRHHCRHATHSARSAAIAGTQNYRPRIGASDAFGDEPGRGRAHAARPDDTRRPPERARLRGAAAAATSVVQWHRSLQQTGECASYQGRPAAAGFCSSPFRLLQH